MRYAPQSFRRWGPYAVATTALGGIAYLADFSIGGAIALGHGYTNALIAILVAAVVIFLTGIPIAYYSARYGVDMDLLTRGSGFGYLGSTLTSIVYASFCFIFFALEGSIMAQALKLGLHIPINLSYFLSCVIVLPLVIFGMSALSKMQVWTQPIWLAMMAAPFLIILINNPHSYSAFTHWGAPAATTISRLSVSAPAPAPLCRSVPKSVSRRTICASCRPRRRRTPFGGGPPSSRPVPVGSSSARSSRSVAPSWRSTSCPR